MNSIWDILSKNAFPLMLINGFIPANVANDLLKGHFHFLSQFANETQLILQDDRGLDKKLIQLIKTSYSVPNV